MQQAIGIWSHVLVYVCTVQDGKLVEEAYTMKLIRLSHRRDWEDDNGATIASFQWEQELRARKQASVHFNLFIICFSQQLQ